MTVSYTAKVASCGKFGCFLKLLWRWRGSIYKLVWRDLLIFLTLYYVLTMMYNTLLTQSQQTTFENIVQYCNTSANLIPLSFVLGYYVSIVMTRWWEQYISIPWPDPVAVYVSVNLHGQDERGRVMRRTIMRYVNLCLTMVLIMISKKVKKRFPTMAHLVDAGFLEESERSIIEAMPFPAYPKHWMPIVWASSIVTRARKEGRIRDDFAVNTIIHELNKFRGMCNVLMFYDNISVPLVYTQVVTLAVYTYFLCEVVGTQYTNRLNGSYGNYIEMYFPFFSTLQFFFYMGWLKVAETLINPFGEDDDDFELNWIIDRNLQVSYLIVDEMHDDHPQLIRDQYWDEVFPTELPYANEDDKREEPPEPSTGRLDYTTGSQTRLVSTSSNVTSHDKITKLPISPTTRSDISIVLEDDKNSELMAWPRISTSQQNLRHPTPFDEEQLEEEEYFEDEADGSEEQDSSQINEFELLKNARGHQRRERQKRKFMRNLNTATQLNNNDLTIEQQGSNLRMRVVQPTTDALDGSQAQNATPRSSKRSQSSYGSKKDLKRD